MTVASEKHCCQIETSRTILFQNNSSTPVTCFKEVNYLPEWIILPGRKRSSSRSREISWLSHIDRLSTLLVLKQCHILIFLLDFRGLEGNVSVPFRGPAWVRTHCRPYSLSWDQTEGRGPTLRGKEVGLKLEPTGLLCGHGSQGLTREPSRSLRIDPNWTRKRMMVRMAALGTIVPVGYVPDCGLTPLSESPSLFFQRDIQVVWDQMGWSVEMDTDCWAQTQVQKKGRSNGT